MENKKKALCKFKQTCPQWLSKKDCGFDHVLCKFNQTCKNKQTCIFYHMSKPSFDKPKSQTLCKFGSRCSKPGCPFKHQKSEQQVQNNVNQNNINIIRDDKNVISEIDKSMKVCKFDQKCFKANCWFKHPNRQKLNQKNGIFNSSPKREQNINRKQNFQTKVEPQINIGNNSFQNSSKGLHNQYCMQYLLSNNCQNGEKCQKSHEFTQKNSIKRIFFSNEILQSEFNAVFYEHSKQNQKQNKQIIYAVQQKDTISFRKLVSSQNLYKDYGGINANQQNKTYLRSITNQLFKTNGKINGIQSFIYNQNQYLVYGTGSAITIFNTSKGQLNQFQISREGNQITGCVLIPNKSTLLISTIELGIKKFQFNSSIQQFQEKPFSEVVGGLKCLKITDSQILGENIIYGITVSDNLVLINKDLTAMIVSFTNGGILNDVDVCLANNKIPIALVCITFGSRQHQIMSVNLLNLQKETILQYEFTSGIDKILTIEGHLMIQIKNKGLIIYKANEYEKQIGLIPFLNQIQQVRKDNKGNLLILQRSSMSSKGSISIFKIKRI